MIYACGSERASSSERLQDFELNINQFMSNFHKV